MIFLISSVIKKIMQNNKKNNNFLLKKSKAQHVVELALIMPFFIICFSFMFQLMVETFSKYKFSYVFTDSVRNVINNPEIFDSVANAADYDIASLVQTKLLDEITEQGSRIPFDDVTVEKINSDETTFLRGGYQLVSERLFFGETGKEYFYFTIPVNFSYVSPLILNKTTHDVESFFNFYFKYYSTKYTEADDTETTETTETDTTDTGT